MSHLIALLQWIGTKMNGHELKGKSFLISAKQCFHEKNITNKSQENSSACLPLGP